MNTQATIKTKQGAVKIGKQTSNLLPQKKDATFNDRDRINDILVHEKHMLWGYTTGINETFNPDLFQLLKANREELQKIHSYMLDNLFELGEYTADLALPEQIADTYDVFNGYKTQFPFPEGQGSWQ